MAQEVLVVNGAVANLIREGKTAQMYSTIQTGSQYGMQTLESALADLYHRGLITAQDAISKSSRPDELKRMIGSQAKVY